MAASNLEKIKKKCGLLVRVWQIYANKTNSMFPIPILRFSYHNVSIIHKEQLAVNVDLQ